MPNWQLLVYPDQDALEVGVDAIRQAAGGAGDTIRTATSLSRARKLLDDLTLAECNLLVIGSSTPEERGYEQGVPTREPTKRFIKLLKDQHRALPVIVLSTVPDEPLGAFLDAFDNTALIKFDAKMRDNLLLKATHALALPREPQAGEGTQQPPPDYLELDITLEDVKYSFWAMERRGRIPYEDRGVLPLDTSLFERIAERSSKLDGDLGNTDWRGTLNDLARELEELLFGQGVNKIFWRKFVRERERSGGLERTRIRFAVSPNTHPVFVEALKEQEDREHWMLNLPIFRRYPAPGARFPLFKDIASRRGRINCLVIEADREGGQINFGGTTHTLSTLKAVQQEAKDVVTIFETARRQGDTEWVRHLTWREALDSGDPVEFVLQALDERPWHVVHFAGHAVRGQHDTGLVLSAESNCILPVERFSKHLVGAQFVFLSCCRSADSTLIMRVAEQSVPAVLGFRWRVDDQGAASFAHSFYTELFNTGNSRYKYLEYAFRDARKCLYNRNSNDPTWASPMLVLQLRQAQAA